MNSKKLPLIPTAAELIERVEQHFEAEVKVETMRSRSTQLGMDLQCLIIWLLRVVLGFNYDQIEEILEKDRSAIKNAMQRFQSRPELREGCVVIYQELISREVDYLELQAELQRIARSKRPAATDVFIAELSIRHLEILNERVAEMAARSTKPENEKALKYVYAV